MNVNSLKFDEIFKIYETNMVLVTDPLWYDETLGLWHKPNSCCDVRVTS